MAENARIDDLRKRLEREPGSRLFAQLAEELRKAGDLGEAISICKAGLEKQPAFWSARMTLGRALQDTGDVAGAIPEFEAVLKAAPDNILASRLLAESLEAKGDLAGAVARYKTTLALAPGDAQVQTRLAQVEAKLTAPPASRAAPPAPTVPIAIVPPQPEAEAATMRARALPMDGPIPLVDAEESFELESPYMAAGGPSPAPPRPPAPEPAPVFPPATPPVAAPAVEARPPMPWEPPTPIEPPSFDFEPVPAYAVPAPPPPVAPPEPPIAAPVAVTGPEAALAPALEADAEPEPEPEPGPELATSTLAELYFNQGHTERAIDVYRQLVEREPGNERASARLTELNALEKHLKAEERRGTLPEPADPRAARRAAIERTIVRLEGLLAAVRRG